MNVIIVSYDDHFEQIREVRDEVFINEQSVPESIEIDGLDSDAIHAIVFDNETVVGTGRILLDGHIGRMAVKAQYRGKGIGKLLLETLIGEAMNLNISEVWLSSQCHAMEFYEKLGFVAIGTIYKEAQIDHVKMKRDL